MLNHEIMRYIIESVSFCDECTVEAILAGGLPTPPCPLCDDRIISALREVWKKQRKIKNIKHRDQMRNKYTHELVEAIRCQSCNNRAFELLLWKGQNRIDTWCSSCGKNIEWQLKTYETKEKK